MKRTITITLPLPDPKLSPNKRLHWAEKAKIVKAHRRYSRAIVSDMPNEIRFDSYRLVFTWGDARRRDKDNASACCKSYLDGIADGIGQDDSEWDFNGVKFNEPSKAGARLEIVFEVRESK